MTDLKKIADNIRLNIIRLSSHAHAAHVGSCLSCADILAALYFGGFANLKPKNAAKPDRDRLVFSKGHSAAALFCTLQACGFFTEETLFQKFNQPGGWQEHPNFGDVPGVETASGSLGHGLPMALGMALASSIAKIPCKVFAVIGDGECEEGSIWEAAMLAGAQKTENLCVIVDFNKWQATGRTKEIMAIEPLADKWRSFGWHALEIDGHNLEELCKACKTRTNGKPLAIVAHTIKGKGVSFMEDDNNWHYRIPSKEDAALAEMELNRA